MTNKIYLLMYYGIAKHLPRNETLILGGACKGIRRWLCKRIFKESGIDININTGAYFGSGVNIRLGDYSSIGQNCQVANDVTIGKDVMMAPEVIIFSVSHETSDPQIPMRLQGNKAANPVVIEDDVWIGQRAIILPGVTVGKGSIIASAAVVTKNVSPYSIVGGNPAKPLKSRKKESI